MQVPKPLVDNAKQRRPDPTDGTEIKAQIQTLSTELADQSPELLSDLDFKDILSLSPER